jgi:hypothetical protein
MSPHARPGADQIQEFQNLRKRVKDPISLSNKQSQEVQKMIDAFLVSNIQRNMPSTTFQDTKSLLDEVLDATNELNEVISQRALDGSNLDSVGGVSPGLAIRKAVAASSNIVRASTNVINGLNNIKSDTHTIVQDAVGCLRVDVWGRNLAAQSRLTIFNTNETRESYLAQVDPSATALYRPFKNESIYSISQRFYGTPYNHRAIMERNKLTSPNMTGTELLIIPELVAG